MNYSYELGNHRNQTGRNQTRNSWDVNCEGLTSGSDEFEIGMDTSGDNVGASMWLMSVEVCLNGFLVDAAVATNTTRLSCFPSLFKGHFKKIAWNEHEQIWFKHIETYSKNVCQGRVVAQEFGEKAVLLIQKVGHGSGFGSVFCRCCNTCYWSIRGWHGDGECNNLGNLEWLRSRKASKKRGGFCLLWRMNSVDAFSLSAFGWWKWRIWSSQSLVITRTG